MLYIISLLAVVLVGFGTIVWRIRSAEQQENMDGGPGGPNNNKPNKREDGSYVYTVKPDTEVRGNSTLMKGRLQPVRIFRDRY